MKLQERILGFLLGIGVGTAIGFFLHATEDRK
jgi:ABC-type nitrate/sulfonate/bicarbonate transport system permease component